MRPKKEESETEKPVVEEKKEKRAKKEEKMDVDSSDTGDEVWKNLKYIQI